MRMTDSRSCLEFVEGWLHVWELDHLKEERLFLEAYRPEPQWRPQFCVFDVHNKVFSFFETEPNVDSDFSEVDEVQEVIHTRLDGGRGNFHRRCGYRAKRSQFETQERLAESADSDNDSVYHTNLSCSQSLLEGAHESDSDYIQDTTDTLRRHSQPAYVSSPTESLTSIATAFKYAGHFIKKSFKSSNSVSSVKQNRKSSNASTNSDSGLSSLTVSAKNARSQESLPSPSGMHSIDLSAHKVEVKPLHSSVLGQGHFFHVSTAQGSKYISCSTSGERDKWITSLRRTIRPQEEHSRRSDCSLKIWIVEAKNLIPKRSYFCDILLDQTLYARTSVKTMTDMLFWGEHFEFRNLPGVDSITVSVYRDAEKKKKKDKNVLIGSIHISAPELENRQLTEKWITCQTTSLSKTGKEAKNDPPLIRVKARLQVVDILPLDCYQDFIQYLCCDYKSLCHMLEPLLAVREKEDFAICLVHILQRKGQACEFLSDLVMEEISHLDNEQLTFRGNSIATKGVEAYMKLIGEKYLQDTLGDLIHQLVQSSDDCEVDPSKVATPQLLSCQQKNLDMYSNMFWVKIINSFCYFPTELRKVFTAFRDQCCSRGKAEFSDNLISGCIFLRFLCPAILYPSLFNLTQEYPHERASRNLMLIAKTIQTLANFTQFGVKEEYMTFMNSFVQKEEPNMKNFLQKISNRETNNQFLEFDGYIDLGKELSVLHALLQDSRSKHSELSGPKFDEMNKILNGLTAALEDPSAGQKKVDRSSQIYDNLMCPSAQDISVPSDTVPLSKGTGKSSATTPLSPTGILIDVLQRLGQSTEDLPGLANRNKSAEDLPALVDRSKSGSGSQWTLRRDHSTESMTVQTTGRSREVGNEQNYGRVETRRVCNSRTPPDEGEVLKSGDYVVEDASGDYVDLMLTLDSNNRGRSRQQGHPLMASQQTLPLAFANPLFRLQSNWQGATHGQRDPLPHEPHPGIFINQAQAVRRLSSESSLSSSPDEEEEPWQVNLLKTSSPIEQPDPGFSTTDYLPERPNVGHSTSSISNSSFYSCSSDLDPSRCTSLNSPISPVLSSSPHPAWPVEPINHRSTFPRHSIGSLEQMDATSHNPRFQETHSADDHVEERFSSSPNKNQVLFRHFSHPAQFEEVCQTADSSQCRIRPSGSQNKVYSGAKPSLSLPPSPLINDHNSIPHYNNPSPLSSLGNTHQRHISSPSSSSVFRFPSHKSQEMNKVPHQSRSSAAPLHIKSRPYDETEMDESGKVELRNPPFALVKSAGWQVASQVGRTCSLPETSLRCESAPHSPVQPSPRNSEGSRSTPASPLHPKSYDPYSNISNSSVQNLIKIWHQKRKGQEESNKSSNESSTLGISENSRSGAVSSTEKRINSNSSPRQGEVDKYQNVSSNSRRSSLISHPENLNRPANVSQTLPLTLKHQPQLHSLSSSSKYAVVRPQTTHCETSPRSTKAASYHSTPEKTASDKRTHWSVKTSHSLDLGHSTESSGNGSTGLYELLPGETTFDQRTPSDRHLATTRTSSEGSVASCQTPARSVVLMGVGSVIRKLQDQEKTKTEYEHEVLVLHQQLKQAQQRLEQTELRLQEHEVSTRKLTQQWQHRLAASEQQMRQQQAQKQQQMRTIIKRLELATSSSLSSVWFLI